MESLFIKDFRRGLDTRRSELTQQPGTLEVLTNGFVNQGGEIESRKAFVRTAQIADSFGLQTTSSGLYTFGSANTPGGYPLNIGTVGTPIYVNYQQLKHPQDMFDGTTNVVPMTEVVSSTEFRGKAWVVAKFGSSGTFGYYDGTLVYDFTNGVVYSFLSTNAKIAQFIEQMIDRTTGYTAATVSNVVTVTGQPGQPFTTTSAETTAGNGTLDAADVSPPTEPVAAKVSTGGFEIIAGTSSAGTNKISNVKVNGVTITSAAVDWTTSNEITAGLVAANIQAYTSSPNYNARAEGARVIITGLAADGDASNDFVVEVNAAGNVCIGKAAFQATRSAGGTFGECTDVTIAGVSVLDSKPIAFTSTTQIISDIAADINDDTGTHGYLACPIGSTIFISKAQTKSSDAPLPIFITTNATGVGNGIFEVGTDTTGVGTLQAILVVTTLISYQPSPRQTNPGYWRVYFTLSVQGGYPPYQAPTWFGGTVTKIDDTHYYANFYTGTTKIPSPPAIYCTVVDSALLKATSNTL